MTNANPKLALPPLRPAPTNPHHDPALDALWARQARESYERRQAELAEIAARPEPVKVVTKRRRYPKSKGPQPSPEVSYQEIVHAATTAVGYLVRDVGDDMDTRRGDRFLEAALRISATPPEQSVWKRDYSRMYWRLLGGLIRKRSREFHNRLGVIKETFHTDLRMSLYKRPTAFGIHATLKTILDRAGGYVPGTPEREVLDDMIGYYGAGLVLAVALKQTPIYVDTKPALDSYREIRDADAEGSRLGERYRAGAAMVEIVRRDLLGEAVRRG